MKTAKKITFLLLLSLSFLPICAQKVSFSANGFELGEVYTENQQEDRLKGAQIIDDETESGLETVYSYGNEDDENFTFFQFFENELEEFRIANTMFEFREGDVAIKVGDKLDKLKAIPRLTTEQAMDYSEREPRRIEGGWVLKHPDLPEEEICITVYEKNGIITAVSGMVLL